MREEEFLKLERRVEEVTDWRHRPANVYTQGGRALVSQANTACRDLGAAVKAAVDALGGVRRALQPQDRVLLKANFNSPDPFPASTDLSFLTAVVTWLRSEGITNLTLGERAGWPSMPTANVLQTLGVSAAARQLNLPVIDFDAGPWMDVRLGPQAQWWQAAAFHQSLKTFDKIVYLPCMKHHYLGTFTMSLKLGVGLTHPVDMVYLHADLEPGKTDEPMFLKMLELNLPVGPDLILMDGRKSFVTGGPAKGEVVEPQVIMASGDQIALDVEGVKRLQAYPRDNLIQGPVWEMPLIRRAIALGLGAKGEADYQVVTA